MSSVNISFRSMLDYYFYLTRLMHDFFFIYLELLEGILGKVYEITNNSRLEM